MPGYHALGAVADRVITIRVKNALDLAKTQSAAAGVAALVPGVGKDFVEGETYKTVAQKISESLAAQKADADVQVIDRAGIVPQPTTYFTAKKQLPQSPGEEDSEAWKFTKTYGWGVATGVGVSGLVALAWRYFFRGE